MGDVSASEVASAVHEVAQDAFEDGVKTADDLAIAAIESAEQQIDDATRAAEQLAEAAMMTKLGGEIAALREELNQWRNEQNSQASEFQSLTSQVQKIEGQIAALTILEVTEHSPSIPPQSAEAVTEAIAEVTEILPNSLSDVVESPAVPPEPARPRKALWI